MEIVRRVVAVIAVLLIFPAIIFLPVVDFQVSSPVVDELLSAQTDRDVALGESLSGKDLYQLATGKHELSGFFGSGEKLELHWPALLAAQKTSAVLFAVFLALALIAAIFVAVWSAVSYNRIVAIAASGAGVLFTVLSKVFFGRVCAPLLAGQINVITLFQQVTGKATDITAPLTESSVSGLGSTILSSLFTGLGSSDFVKFDFLRLGGFVTAIIACFVVVAVWNLSFYLVELGDESEKLKKQAAKKSKKKA